MSNAARFLTDFDGFGVSLSNPIGRYKPELHKGLTEAAHNEINKRLRRAPPQIPSAQ